MNRRWLRAVWKGGVGEAKGGKQSGVDEMGVEREKKSSLSAHSCLGVCSVRAQCMHARSACGAMHACSRGEGGDLLRGVLDVLQPACRALLARVLVALTEAAGGWGELVS